MTVIAVDFPALERPTKATSAPWSLGNCPGAAALIRNSARGNRLMIRLRQLSCGSKRPATFSRRYAAGEGSLCSSFGGGFRARVVYNSAPSHLGTKRKERMAKKMSRLSGAALAATVALALVQVPALAQTNSGSAAPPATAPAAAAPAPTSAPTAAGPAAADSA